MLPLLSTATPSGECRLPTPRKPPTWAPLDTLSRTSRLLRVSVASTVLPSPPPPCGLLMPFAVQVGSVGIGLAGSIRTTRLLGASAPISAVPAASIGWGRFGCPAPEPSEPYVRPVGVPSGLNSTNRPFLVSATHSVLVAAT